MQNGFLSKQTASERIPKYARNDEIERIINEDIEKRKLDTQDQLDKIKAETEAKIIELKASQSGSDINTGYGKKKRETDRWGNRPGENNWDQWNRTH